MAEWQRGDSQLSPPPGPRVGANTGVAQPGGRGGAGVQASQEAAGKRVFGNQVWGRRAKENRASERHASP